MKKLMIATMIFAAASLYAEQGPTPPTYCECTGRGIPVSPVQQLTPKTAPQKAHLGFAAHTFYELELWVMLFTTGI